MKITYKDRHNKLRVIECAKEEIPSVLRALADEEERAARRGNIPAWQAAIEGLIGPVADKSLWTRALFGQFIETLGDSQKRILGFLVRNRRMTAEEMCRVAKVDGNQALAGVVSGISKAAGALDIPARSVYVVEDERKSGSMTKCYAIAMDFLQMALEMNWPES